MTNLRAEAQVLGWKGLTDEQRAGGMWVAFSPDGVRWRTAGPVLAQASDTTHSLVYDRPTRTYLGFGRMGFGRTVALTESADALHWSAPRKVLACDVVGIRGDEPPLVVELKQSLTLKLLFQAVDRLSIADHVYVLARARLCECPTSTGNSRG